MTTSAPKKKRCGNKPNEGRFFAEVLRKNRSDAKPETSNLPGGLVELGSKNSKKDTFYEIVQSILDMKAAIPNLKPRREVAAGVQSKAW